MFNCLNIKKYCLCCASLFGMILLGCNHRSAYEKLVERELGKGHRQDSLFLGVTFGMTQRQFYDHITPLGYQGIVKQGGDMSVLCEIDSFSNPININFFPKFRNNRIYELPLIFTYRDWMPWREDTKVERLLEEVLLFTKQHYGDDFIEIKNPKNDQVAHVTVEGNRRISVFIDNYNKVKVRFTDLSEN